MAMSYQKVLNPKQALSGPTSIHYDDYEKRRAALMAQTILANQEFGEQVALIQQLKMRARAIFRALEELAEKLHKEGSLAPKEQQQLAKLTNAANEIDKNINNFSSQLDNYSQRVAELAKEYEAIREPLHQKAVSNASNNHQKHAQQFVQGLQQIKPEQLVANAARLNKTELQEAKQTAIELGKALPALLPELQQNLLAAPKLDKIDRLVRQSAENAPDKAQGFIATPSLQPSSKKVVDVRDIVSLLQMHAMMRELRFRNVLLEQFEGNQAKTNTAMRILRPQINPILQQQVEENTDGLNFKTSAEEINRVVNNLIQASSTRLGTMRPELSRTDKRVADLHQDVRSLATSTNIQLSPANAVDARSNRPFNPTPKPTPKG